MQETTSSAVTPQSSERPRPTFAIAAAVVALLCALLALAGYGQPVVMGIVQGLGEPLPISSSGHLILVPWLFGWEIGSLAFDVALHLGTLLALVGYFWRDWLEMLRAIPEAASWSLRRFQQPENTSLGARTLVAVALATIPAAIVGVLLNDWAETTLRSPLLVAANLTIFGVLLYVADRVGAQSKTLTTMRLPQALLIGIAQACALIPGVSRSGSTMTMSRFLGFDRATAARFSFLMSMPITAAAIVFKLPEILAGLQSETANFLIGMVVSAAVGALAIHFLLGYVRRAGFGIFTVYRIALAAIIVLVATLG